MPVRPAKPSRPTKVTAGGRDSRRLLAVLAFIATLALPRVPVLVSLVYPLRLFATAIHEGSHALAALLTGGHVLSIQVFANASGVTYASGTNRFIFTSAGYLGSTLFGCLLLVGAQHRRWHRPILLALAGFFAMFTFYARSVMTMEIGLGVLAVLFIAWRWQFTDGIRYFLFDFIAFTSCLYALDDLVALVAISTGWAQAVGPSGGQTDATILAHLTGVGALVWAGLWGGISVLATAYAARAAWRAAGGTSSAGKARSGRSRRASR